jgi:hypothetical protein
VQEEPAATLFSAALLADKFGCRARRTGEFGTETTAALKDFNRRTG